MGSLCSTMSVNVPERGGPQPGHRQGAALCCATPGPPLNGFEGPLCLSREDKLPGLGIAMGSIWIFCCPSPGPQISEVPFEAEPVMGQRECGSTSCSCLQPRWRGAERPSLLFLSPSIFWSILRLEKQFGGCCQTATMLCLPAQTPPGIFSSISPLHSK